MMTKSTVKIYDDDHHCDINDDLHYDDNHGDTFLVKMTMAMA